MTKIFKFILWTILVISFIDFTMFLVWGLSGQQPIDNFYFGSITSHVIQLIK